MSHTKTIEKGVRGSLETESWILRKDILISVENGISFVGVEYYGEEFIIKYETIIKKCNESFYKGIFKRML